MADPLQIQVGATLDPNSKARIQVEINSLQSKPINIEVTADVDAARKTIDAFVSTYRNKDIKLYIDADIKGGGIGGNSILKSARELKQKVENIFNGISFNAAITGGSGSIEKERKRIEAEFNKLGKINVDISAPILTQDASGKVQSFALKLREAGREVQTLSYSLRQIGNKEFFVLDADNSNITAIKNVNAEIDKLSRKLTALQTSWNKSNVQGKIVEQQSFNEIAGNINNLQARLNELKNTAYVMPYEIEDIFKSIENIKVDIAGALFDSSKTKQASKDLETFKKRVDAVKQSLQSWVAYNPKMKSSGDIASIFTELENFSKLEKLDVNDYASFDNLKKKIHDVQIQAHQLGLTGETTFKNFTSKVKELATYLGANLIFTYLSTSIKAVANNVVELDTALTELKKTTEGTQQDYLNFVENAANTAQEVGAKVSDVIQSAAEWSRSGFSLQESGELARAAIIYTNVSEYENVSDATTSLIAIMKAYGYEASNVIDIVDKLNAVGNTTATTSAGLGDALLRSASALSTAGNTIDESLGLIVAANNTVQNPEKVGNGLKTISLRLRNTKGELEALGEESDGAVESITKLQTQLLNETHGQVNIFDEQGQFKNTSKILTELASVWKSLDSIEQANITTLVAGATQANIFNGIMQNMSDGAAAVSTSLNSSGSAIQENARYMDSIQGKLAQLSSTVQELSSTLISSNFFKGIITGLQTLLSLLNDFISTAGTIPTILGGVGITAFIKNIAKFKEIGSVLNDLKSGQDISESFQKLSTWQQKIVASYSGYAGVAGDIAGDIVEQGSSASKAAGGFKSLSTAIKATAISAGNLGIALLKNPITWVVAAIGGAAAYAYHVSNEYKNAAENVSNLVSEYNQTSQELESVNSELETTQTRIAELQAMQANGTLTLADESELIALQRQNAELEQRQRILENLANTQQHNASVSVLDALNARSMSQYSKDYGYQTEEAVNYTDKITAVQEDLRHLSRLYDERQQLQNKIDQALSDGDTDLYDDLQSRLTAKDGEISRYNSLMSETMAEFEEYRSTLAQDTELGTIVGGEDALKNITAILEQYSRLGTEQSELERAFSSLDSFFSGASGNDATKDYILSLVESGWDATDAIAALGLSLNDLGLNQGQEEYLNRYFNDLKQSATEAADAVDKIDSSLSGIATASESANAGDNFDKYLTYIDNARRYFAQGKTGIDDFKTVASSLNDNSQDTADNLEQFKHNLDRIKKYLTVDTDSKLTQSSSSSNIDGTIKSSITLDDGQLTVTKQNMEDLAAAFEEARVKASATGKEFRSTADLAEALDIPIDFLEYSLGKMQDYDISTPFDDLPKSSQLLSQANAELDKLKTLYDSLGADASNKDYLAERIADWETQLQTAETDINSLDTDIVLNMRIAYNLEEMQQAIDEARARAQSGGGTTAYAEVIAQQATKNTYQFEQMGLDRDGIEVPVFLQLAQDNVDNLLAQLSDAAKNADYELVEQLQPQVDEAQALLGSLLDGLQQANPELNINTNIDEANAALTAWLTSTDSKEVLIDYIMDGQEPPEQMDALMDYILASQEDPEEVSAWVNYLKQHQDDPDAMDAALRYFKVFQDDPDPEKAALDYYLRSQAPASSDEAAVNYYRGSQQAPKDLRAKVFYYMGNDPANLFSRATGTAQSEGSTGVAYAGGKSRGDWSVGTNTTALINEIGAELIVRDGKWLIANNGYPGFFKLKRNDIVFSAGQTKALLEHGKTNSYGKFIGALSSGTTLGKAFTSGSTSGLAFASGTTTVDWFEILLNRAERIVKQFTNKLENTFKGFNTRMSALTSAITSTKDEITKTQSAYTSYMQKADAVKLSDSLKQQVRDGAYYIYDYDEDTQKLIESYQEYYEKALDAKDAIDELTKSLSELYKEAFDIVATRYDNEFAALSNRADMIQTSIDLAEAEGYFANAGSYEDLIKISRSEIAKGQQEYIDLTKKLDEAVASGAVEKFSDEWWDMYNQILEVANSIQEAELAVAELETAIQQLEWDQFDYLQERISQITEEADFLIGLLERSDLFDESGKLTSEGLATVSLHAVNYDTYMEQAKQYAEEIEKIEAELANDPNNTNLIERREELLALQRDSIEAAYDEKDAIAELIQDGIDKEMEAVENLIDAYTSALDSAKDLYDYRKKVAEYSDDIASLRKQLAAYQGDTSEEARAEIQRITVALAEAEENLREAEYDKYISDQKKLLDELQSEYQTVLNERLDNIDVLVEQLIADANANTDEVTSTINDAAANAGYSITENMSNILTDTNGQIAGVTSVLHDIEAQVDQIINAVDKIATDENGIPILDEDGTPAHEMNPQIREEHKLVSEMKTAQSNSGVSVAAYEPISTQALDNYSVSLQAAQIDFPNVNSVDVTHTGDSSTTNQIAVSAPITITIDHVSDYNDFVTQLQADPQFEKMVQMMTVNQLAGKSSLEKYRLKWRGN